MPRFTPRQSDVDKFVSAYRRTSRLLEDARESVTASGDVPEWLAADIVPALPEIDVDELDTQGLRVEFATRDDFNRTMRYMDRLQRESRKDVNTDESKGITQLGYYGTLTAVRGDTVDGLEGVQVRRERGYIEQARQRESLRRLESQGVTMERVPIMKVDPETGEATQAYSSSRHPLYTYVPSTMEDLQRYRELINRNESLAILPPDAEELPEIAQVEQLGSYRPVRSRSRRMTGRDVAARVTSDTVADMRTTTYFENYALIAEALLPDTIAGEIRAYVAKIESMSPSRRKQVYEMIADTPDDAGSLDYLYHDMSASISTQVTNILKFWREKVAPEIGMKAPSETEVGSITVELEREGYMPDSGQALYDEYQRRKAKGKVTTFTFEDMRRLVKGS